MGVLKSMQEQGLCDISWQQGTNVSIAAISAVFMSTHLSPEYKLEQIRDILEELAELCPCGSADIIRHNLITKL